MFLAKLDMFMFTEKFMLLTRAFGIWALLMSR